MTLVAYILAAVSVIFATWVVTQWWGCLQTLRRHDESWSLAC